MKLEALISGASVFSAPAPAQARIMAADEAVKATNTEVVSIELPRDTKRRRGPRFADFRR